MMPESQHSTALPRHTYTATSAEGNITHGSLAGLVKCYCNMPITWFFLAITQYIVWHIILYGRCAISIGHCDYSLLVGVIQLELSNASESDDIFAI